MAASTRSSALAASGHRGGPAARLGSFVLVDMALLGLVGSFAGAAFAAAGLSAAALRGLPPQGLHSKGRQAGRMAWTAAGKESQVAFLELELATAKGQAEKEAKEAAKELARAEEALKRVEELFGLLKGISKSTGGALLAAGVMGEPMAARDLAVQEMEANKQLVAEINQQNEEALVKLEVLEAQVSALTQRAVAAEQESGQLQMALQAAKERVEMLSAGIKSIAKSVGTDGGLLSIFKVPSEEELLQSTLTEIQKMKDTR